MDKHHCQTSSLRYIIIHFHVSVHTIMAIGTESMNETEDLIIKTAAPVRARSCLNIFIY